MAGIRLYQPDEIIKEYVYSWHIRDEQTVTAMKLLAKDRTGSLQDIFDCLEGHILSQVAGFVKAVALSKEQTLALIKLIYLQEELYHWVDIFNPGRQKAFLEEQLARFGQKYALPTAHLSEMIPQVIKIYNPLQRIRLRLQRILGRVRK